MTNVDSRRYSDHTDTGHSWEAGLGSTEEPGLTISFVGAQGTAECILESQK